MAETQGGGLRSSVEVHNSRPGDIRATRDPRPAPQTESDYKDKDRSGEGLVSAEIGSTSAVDADTEPNQTPKKRPTLRGLAARAVNAFKDEWHGGRKIPAEEIQDSTVAHIIWSHLRNPVAGTGPGEIPFSIVDVMANAGYVGMLRTSDYMRQFPEVYPRMRLALTNLTREGILEADGKFGQQDSHNETIYYHIPRDESGPQRQAKLQELASHAQEVSPKYRMS